MGCTGDCTEIIYVKTSKTVGMWKGIKVLCLRIHLLQRWNIKKKAEFTMWALKISYWIQVNDVKSMRHRISKISLYIQGKVIDKLPLSGNR